MKAFIILICISLTGFALQAADGSSGCGPGWYVLKDNSLVSSSLRATTNGMLSPVVLVGMTVGSSNCTKHSIVENEKQSLYYVAQNTHDLKAEAAQASGEHLNALALVIGCDASAQTLFNYRIQNRHQEIFSQETPEKTLTEIYTTILTNPELTHKCSLHNG